MSKTLQHGAASKIPKRRSTDRDEEREQGVREQDV